MRDGHSDSGDTEEASPREFLERFRVCSKGRHDNPVANSMRFWLRSSWEEREEKEGSGVAFPEREMRVR